MSWSAFDVTEVEAERGTPDERRIKRRPGGAWDQLAAFSNPTAPTGLAESWVGDVSRGEMVPQDRRNADLAGWAGIG